MDSVSADWPGDGVSFTFDADAADSTDLADAIELMLKLLMLMLLKSEKLAG